MIKNFGTIKNKNNTRNRKITQVAYPLLDLMPWED